MEASKGMRARLDYFDQNETFAALLPREGTIERFLSSADGGKWGLFHLDAPPAYEGKSYDYFLLRSRWAGYEIGGPEATSVFVLLVDDVAKVQDGFNVKEFEHVAWGMVGGG
jgi:hypothetical protein